MLYLYHRTQVKFRGGFMLKLATVFSGIGAIEQALKRMNMEYEIEFACDNGDIDIDIDYKTELNKIKQMGSVEEKRVYANNIYKQK